MKFKTLFYFFVLVFSFLVIHSAGATVTGTSTQIQFNPLYAMRANPLNPYPVLLLNLNATGTPVENLNSVTISIATSSNATSTPLSTSSFAFVGIARDINGTSTYQGNDPLVGTTTVVSISGATTTINIAANTTSSGNFFVVLQPAATSTFTDNGAPEISTSTSQQFVVRISTSTGVVASSTNATLVGATTTPILQAITHSQTPIIGPSIAATYNGSIYTISTSSGAGEMGTLNIFSTSTPGAAPISTTSMSIGGGFTFTTSTYYSSLWFSDNDVLGNSTSSLSLPLNLSTLKPTITSFAALSDRIILNVSQPLNGMQASNCSNYLINGSAPSCTGAPGTPFINFMGNQIIIKGLSLSGTANFSVNGLIQDTNVDQFPLSYSTTSAPVSTAPVPSVSSVSPNSGSAGTASVTIAGSNFGSAAGTVFFNGGYSSLTGPLPPVAASATAWSNTSITATVPTSSQSGPIQVQTSGGLMSDPNMNTFFNVLGNLYVKIALVSSSSPVTTTSTMKIFVGGPTSNSVYYVGDANGTTFNTGTNVYTIPNASANGYIFAYDTSGADLSAPGGMITMGNSSSSPQILIFPTSTSYNVSGTVTLGSSCSANYQNQIVAVMAVPQGVSMSSPGTAGGVQPVMVQTNISCQASYAVALPGAGTYSVQTMIPPFNGTSTGLISPNNQTINLTTSTQTVSGINFTFNSASYSIYGQIVGTNGSPLSSYNGIWVFAYQPTGGQGSGAQPNSSGNFRIYANPGSYQLSVGGPNLPMGINANALVTTSSAFSSTTLTTNIPNIVLTPPTSYISGSVKDTSNNAISGSDVFAYCSNGPGGGHATTDSQGLYTMYVQPCSSYTVNGFSQTYGRFPQQTNINVANGGNATVNFTINSANFVTISGIVNQNSSPLSGANVWITQGQFGPGVGGGQTNSSGAYSVSIQSGLSNLYVHAAAMGQGELGNILLSSGGVVNSSSTGNTISSNVGTLNIQLSPGNTFTNVFLNAYSPNGGGFANTPTATSSSYDTYQIQVPYSGGGTTYTIAGGIPNFGPIPNTTTTVNSTSTITVAINLSSINYYMVSGTVSGDFNGAYVWAGGPNGGGGTQVSSTTGAFSIKLRQGVYDMGVNKPGDIGTFLSQQNISTTTAGLSLSISASTSSIIGTVTSGGTALSGINVWAKNSSGAWAGAQTDANGSFTLAVAPGAWTINAVGDGYRLNNPVLITAPASGVSLSLSAVSFTPNQQLQSISPTNGGVVQTSSTKVQIPQGALGSGSNNIQVSITDTMNLPSRKGVLTIGNGENINATYASGASQGQSVSTLSSNATLQFVLTPAQLTAAGITTLAQVQQLQIGYNDVTSNAWTYLPTTVSASSSDGNAVNSNLSNLASVTLSGTTGHFSTYAPVLPTSSTAPSTPTSMTASASNGQVSLSWGSVVGAASYNIYRQSGSNYPFLASTTNTSYIDTSVSNGTSYSYEVSALDSVGNESAASAAVSATPSLGTVVSYGGGGSYYSSVITTTVVTSSIATSSAMVSTTTSMAAATSTNITTSSITTAVINTSLSSMTVPQMQQLLQTLTVQLNALLAQAAAQGIQVSALPGQLSGITGLLRVGSRGDNVKVLQNFLISKNAGLAARALANHGATNYFGLLTKKALAEFQKSVGISPASGIFGPKTKAYLQSIGL